MDALLDRTFHAEQRHFWFIGFRRFVNTLLKGATEGISRPRVLDAGCGTGVNLALLESYGVPFGVELLWRGLQFGHARGLYSPDTRQRHAAPLSGCLHGRRRVVRRAVLPSGRRRAGRDCRDVPGFAPGGAIVVNVAALAMLKGDHSTLGGEVRRYTTRELREKLERAGFRIVRMTYTNASLFPITAVVRALQRLRGVKPEAESTGDFYIPPEPVNALLSRALILESKLIAAGIDMPFGSSVLCLARKP